MKEFHWKLDSGFEIHNLGTEAFYCKELPYERLVTMGRDDDWVDFSLAQLEELLEVLPALIKTLKGEKIDPEFQEP